MEEAHRGYRAEEGYMKVARAMDKINQVMKVQISRLYEGDMGGSPLLPKPLTDTHKILNNLAQSRNLAIN